MKINILTLFPEMFSGFKSESIIGKALEKNLLEINIVNIRDFCYDKHKQADDMPFGGGAGMVMKPEPLFRALETVKGKVIYTTPQGVRFNQKLAIELAQEEEITIIAGHYEGIDERVVESKVDLEVSIGDFVLTGGELPAMMMADCIARLVPGVIKKESYENDSFFNGLLDYPHYTRPAEYEGMKVPEVLLSGHHKNIETWRLKESLKRTYLRRRDLLVGRELSKEEKKLLAEIKRELGKEKMIYKLGEKTPKIGENNYIAENATVIGEVVTNENVSIWFGAVVRADMSKVTVGRDSNIQDNCTVHGDTPYPVNIGERVTIGHNCIIHGCTIGDNCVIGMGSILLNGSVIPKNCLVAAGAVVTPKLQAEEGSLIAGSPARVIRALTDENREYLQYAHKVYIEDIEKYKNLEEIK